jgi:mRNA-degrading endonuclease RelE of RelBE toxin-antitoxin system
MDRIEKFLAKLSKEERLEVESYIENILRGKTTNIYTKKLRGRDDIFRFKKGKIRIIYKKEIAGVRIISIGHRNNNTYRDF